MTFNSSCCNILQKTANLHEETKIQQTPCCIKAFFSGHFFRVPVYLNEESKYVYVLVR